MNSVGYCFSAGGGGGWFTNVSAIALVAVGDYFISSLLVVVIGGRLRWSTFSYRYSIVVVVKSH